MPRLRLRVTVRAAPTGGSLMRHLLLLTAAFALAGAVPSFAQVIDKSGRCHDAKGHFAKMDVCKGGGARAMAARHAYKLDAKGKCRDERGRVAKKGLCHA